jgi:hypothetical protein
MSHLKLVLENDIVPAGTNPTPSEEMFFISTSTSTLDPTFTALRDVLIVMEILGSAGAGCAAWAALIREPRKGIVSSTKVKIVCMYLSPLIILECLIPL